MKNIFLIKASYLRWLSFASLLLALSACSLLPKLSDSQQLDSLQHWQVRGKLSVNNGQDAITGYLSWQQKQGHYDLFISGPLGQGATRLQGDANSASLTLANKPTVTASSARALMQKYMGWNFPVQDLQYWVKGQPSPSAKYQAKYDQVGLLSELLQHGWRIEFSRYSNQQGFWLPARIKLTHKDPTGRAFKFIFASKEWTIYD